MGFSGKVAWHTGFLIAVDADGKRCSHPAEAPGTRVFPLTQAMVALIVASSFDIGAL